LNTPNSNLEKNKSGVLDFSVGWGTGNKKRFLAYPKKCCRRCAKTWSNMFMRAKKNIIAKDKTELAEFKANKSCPK